MTRVCICCKYRVMQTHAASDISLYGLPKNDELLNKWVLAIGKTEKKICESSRICSRHFKKDDFRYSIVGGKRFLKPGAIPSLYLNKESKNSRLSDSGDMVGTMENKSLNNTISQVDDGKDNQLSCIIEMKIQTTTEDTNESTEFVTHECCDKTQLSERWEEISTSPVQAKIYWEVAIKRITRQKVILRSLRQKVKRLKKTILELQTRVKKVASSDSQ
ncbi:uncharacterized protein [Anoplolepis gracilipes]|uniref:uncharacterized protein isoform X2 n=1 Tax=Anoplolepis gracilipes TaxID=354296 RepID=UPI003B9E468F